MPQSFKKIVGKGENAGNQHFLFFLMMFSIPSKKKIHRFDTIYFVACKSLQFETV